MVKKIAGYIRTIPSGDPELGIAVTIRDQNTNAQIAVGGMYGGSANPINTDAVTGYFEWTCELSPGPLLVEAQTGAGEWKRRAGKELMQAGDIFVSDMGDILRTFSDGVMDGINNEFVTNASGLNITVQPGMAVMRGRILETRTNRVLPQPPNATLAVRNDLVVLQQHVGGTNVGRQVIALVPGVVNGVDPTINTDPNVLEIVLYRAALANGGSVSTMTDLRPWTTLYLGLNTVQAASLTAGGNLSTADLAKVLKAPTSGLTPAYATMSSRELSDVQDVGPTDQQYLKWVNANSRYEPTTLTMAHGSLTGIDTDTAPTAIHHTLGVGANQAAAGNHTHGASFIASITDTASIDLVMTGSALSANAIFAGTGAASTVARSDHDHNATYSLLAHTHTGVYQPVDTELTQIANLAGPGADRILFWDQSANSYAFLTVANNLVVSGTTLDGTHNHDAAYSPLGHTHSYAPLSHNHAGEPTKIDAVVKGYSTTAVVADTAIATGSLFLSSGITYDVFIIGLAQAHMASGAAGNAQIGAKWESGSTDWGMQVGTELGERPVMIISVIGSVLGDSASHTYTLRGRSTGAGNANFVAATVGAFAIPRNTG